MQRCADITNSPFLIESHNELKSVTSMSYAVYSQLLHVKGLPFPNWRAAWYIECALDRVGTRCGRLRHQYQVHVRGGWVAVWSLEGRILLINLHHSEVFKKDTYAHWKYYVSVIRKTTQSLARTHRGQRTLPRNETGYHDTDVHTITWKTQPWKHACSSV